MKHGAADTGQNGKGSRPRPFSVSLWEYRQRFAETFAAKAREQERKLAGKADKQSENSEMKSDG